ncbi:MAG: hypothetical protein ABIL09_13325 [Gemmatimonadota bacterium]
MPDEPTAPATDRIEPYPPNPRYWQHRGEPVVLLGGSVKDNLFQIPDLAAHLDLLASVGGNYVRNTMSDRQDRGFEVRAFGQRPDERYDLNTWNEEYWRRFADLMRWTSARDIVVQVEVWDRFDHSRGNWETDPYNPANNVNYTHEESGLAPEYPNHPLRNEQPFFYTVPALRNNEVVLPYQQAFVDRMLSISLEFGHVLYCMDNETSGAPEWGAYWSGHIRERARARGVAVETTEMWDKWDVTAPEHRPTLDHPETYSFVDLSQNSWQTGQANWDHAQWVRQYLGRAPRPINSTKIYGADTHAEAQRRGVTAAHAQQTFWRNLIGGFAASRFHRPPSGLGLSEAAQAHIRSARMLTRELDFLRAEPDASSARLRNREPDEAYLTCVPGEQCAVCFMDGGQVELDLSQEEGRFDWRWLEAATGQWRSAGAVDAGGLVPQQAPGPGIWVALLSK